MIAIMMMKITEIITKMKMMIDLMTVMILKMIDLIVKVLIL